MSLTASIVGLAALAIASIKWLRVIQRQHYLVGSVVSMARVWTGAYPLNRLIVFVPWIAAISAFFIDPDLAGIVGALALAAFPIGLGIRGRTSTLAWTARLRRLASMVVVMTGGLIWLIEWAASAGIVRDAMAGIPGVVVIAVFPLVLEIAQVSAAPLERRLSQRFVDQAASALARVGPVVVGITGSYGKTSTKGYVRDLLQGSKRVIASPASFNNRLGLSKAINEHLTGDAEVFVAEMGTYGAGEIADLCTWIPPDIAVITAIGPVHLERFRTERNVLAAKAEILEAAKVVVFNVDHPMLEGLADRPTDKTVWRCGTTDRATDVRVVKGDENVEVIVGGESIGSARLPGVFATNLACAVAVSLEIGVSQKTIMERIALLEPPDHRQKIYESAGGFMIIDDTFNSNPTGAARALTVLAGHGGPEARRVVVTPGMVELGPKQADENQQFATNASHIADDIVIVGRTNRRWLVRGTKAGEASVIVVRTREEAVDWVKANLGLGDVVLYENDLPDHYP